MMKAFVAHAVLMLFALVHGENQQCDKNLEGNSCTSSNARPVTLQQPSSAQAASYEQVPILVWWYEEPFPHYNKHTNIHKLQCSAGTCLTSNDKSLLSDPNTKAFLFYGTSFLANDLPLPRNPDHIWALLHEESPKNNWIFSHEDGIRVFNYTATFSRESNYPLTTQFIVDPNDWVESEYFVSTAEKNRLRIEAKLAPVVYVQRDCGPPSDRDSYVKELMKYIDVDSYGPCLNNKKMPTSIEGFHKLNDKEYFHFLAKYKFHLSFENAICKDYMTEKLFRPLQIGVVPVYMGSSHARQFMPNNHSAIFVSDFKNPKELAKFILELDKDDRKYNSYLDHHKNGIDNDWLDKTIRNRKWKIYSPADKVNFIHRMYAGLECDLCDLIIKRNQMEADHIRDSSKSPPPVLIAKQSDMGCPEPMPSHNAVTYVNKSFCYWQGLQEARALKKMLLAKESSSKTFETKYLKLKTDKYP